MPAPKVWEFPASPYEQNGADRVNLLSGAFPFNKCAIRMLMAALESRSSKEPLDRSATVQVNWACFALPLKMRVSVYYLLLTESADQLFITRCATKPFRFLSCLAYKHPWIPLCLKLYARTPR